MAMAASRKPPPNQTLLNLVEASKPVVAGFLQFLDTAYPLVDKAVVAGLKLWDKAQPYHPQDFFPLTLGLLLIFFGGSLPVTIAAVEAFRICGWDNTKRALVTLHSQFKVALDASRKDDLVDANKDGVADVKQIDSKALVSRKVALFFKVTDPNAVNEGIKGVAAGCSAVVATLRLQFAQTITLGVSLGDVFERTAERYLRPVLEKTLPLEYHKWIGVLISYTCRSIAVTIAWWCTRVISAMHSATRGAQLLLQGVVVLTNRFKVQLPVDLGPDNPLYPLVCGALSGLGLYYQVMRGFGLPFPFNILLLPLRMLEWFLFYALSYGKQ